jgi:hypothetical protein
LTGIDVHVVDYQRSANLEEFGCIVKIYENGRKTMASVNQYEIELGARQLVDYVRGFDNNEPNVAGIYVCRSAIISDSIGFRFVRRNASMLATISRENDRAQASASL